MGCSWQPECLDRGPGNRSKCGAGKHASFDGLYPVSLHVPKTIHGAYTVDTPCHSDSSLEELGKAANPTPPREVYSTHALEAKWKKWNGGVG